MLRLFVCCTLTLFGFAGIAAAEEPFELRYPAGMPKMRIPADNPLTKAKVELGKQLFFDPRLSRDNTISCSSCHDPEKGWSNGERFATGVRGQVGGRSAPTILNSGYFYFQFWDGRANHVEGQALGPIQNPIEMDLTLEEVTEKLNKIPGYKKQFQAVFGSDATPDGVSKAIAAFERTVISGNAPYDRYKAGDKTALSAEAKRGMDLFFGKAHCSACHSGPHFSDGAFHNIGVGIDANEPDVGRLAHSKLGGDRGAFKTPTLREIARTAPYMHDGSEKTLHDVIAYYNRGGTANEHLDEEIFKLDLNKQEIDDLVKFLEEGLTSEEYPLVKAPQLPE